MKVQFTALTLSLAAMPFAFWDMKEIFYANTSHRFVDPNFGFNVKELPIRELKNEQETPFYTQPPSDPTTYSIFLYNNNVKYSFNFVADTFPKTFETARKFFKGTLDENYFENSQFSFYCVKQKLDLHSESENYFKVYNPIKSSSPNVHKISLKKSFTTPSGVNINNKEKGKVEITLNNKPLDLQEELSEYFNKEKKLDNFAKNITSSIQSHESLSAKKLNNLRFATRIGNKEFQRLKDSTILEVYAVLQNKKNQDSIIWGLAKDKNIKDEQNDKFHFITDLENSISVLFNQ